MRSHLWPFFLTKCKKKCLVRVVDDFFLAHFMNKLALSVSFVSECDVSCVSCIRYNSFKDLELVLLLPFNLPSCVFTTVMDTARTKLMTSHVADLFHDLFAQEIFGSYGKVTSVDLAVDKRVNLPKVRGSSSL